MLYIRTTKTTSGSTAVQVVRYYQRKKQIVAHIGSAHDHEELILLKQAASAWIEKTHRQPSLFPEKQSQRLLIVEKCQYLGFRYAFVYETLSRIFTIFKFHLLKNQLLTDLVIARIIEPGSKVRSLQFLEEFLGVHHQRRDLYRQLPTFVHLKDTVETNILAVAKKEFDFNFSLVFYDVTTLYFESFEPDHLSKPGFSKDNKSQQPQILIGLLVSVDGFPVAYQIFEGNTFEGHTLIPIISAFKHKHNIDRLTVVADAAMMSMENIQTLHDSKLNYIVGARTANLSGKLIKEISDKLRGHDRKTIRTATKYGDLICEFSAKRFVKDEREMNKQIKKAQALLKKPGNIKRTKFVKATNSSFVFNRELLKKATLLLGIKGYYTNLSSEVSDCMIIDHYHNLWHVEQAFRIAKSDLRMRPIYHFKQTTIKAHILICFMALAVCKYMELKTGTSIRHITKALKEVTDARILNTLTNEEIILRSEIKEETKQLLKQMSLWY